MAITSRREEFCGIDSHDHDLTICGHNCRPKGSQIAGIGTGVSYRHVKQGHGLYACAYNCTSGSRSLPLQCRRRMGMNNLQLDTCMQGSCPSGDRGRPMIYFPNLHISAAGISASSRVRLFNSRKAWPSSGAVHEGVVILTTSLCMLLEAVATKAS